MRRHRRTYRKLVLRGFRQGISRFLAIFAIVALGVGFFVGIIATAPDMRLSSDRYYDDTYMMDVRVMSTLGLTEADVEAVQNLEGIDRVMPAYSADVLLLTAQDDAAVTRVHSLPAAEEESLNRVELTSGRMPENPGECVIETGGYLFSLPIEIGDTLQLSPDNEDLTDTLAVDSFTVVGTVKSAYYFSVEREHTTLGNGSIELILYTQQQSFAYEVFTDIFATVSGAEALNCFSEDYRNLVADTSARLETLADARERARRDELVADAQAELDDAWSEYLAEREDAEKELADAEQELARARAELETQRARLADGRSQYESGLEEYQAGLEAFETEIAQQREALEAGRAELALKREELTAMQEQLDANKAQIDALRPFVDQDPQIAEQVAEYDANVAVVSQGFAMLEAREAELEAGAQTLEETAAQTQSELDAAKAALDETLRTLDSGAAALAAAQEELAAGETEYEQARQEAEQTFAEAEQELEQAQQEIADIPEAEWYLFDRSDNLGFESFRKNADNLEAIAKIFPLFFFLIAALVSLTTMTRLVEEERGLIGTLKALGYNNGAIAAKYLIYAGVASVSGSVLGFSLGFKVFPTILWNAYEMMYTLPPLLTPFHWGYAVLSSAAAVLLCLFATYSACRHSLGLSPAGLLQPRAPKAGKRVFLERITPLWKRLKFTHKVTVRNLLRYKKRFFMTVIGIAGCTALLVAGFGLRDSISDIVDKQFNEIYQYNMIVSLRNSSPMQKGTALRALLDDPQYISGYTLASQESATVSAGGKSQDITLCVPEDTQALPEFVTLRDRRTHEPVSFDTDSAVVTEKLAEQLGIQVGDQIQIDLGDGLTADVTVTGVTENYLSGYVYLAREVYEDVFGQDLTFHTLYGVVLDADAQRRDEISARILRQEDVNGVSFTNSIGENFQDMLSKIDYIVIVLIVSAGTLAFIVLYNLTNINIAERERELATIKVLGFYDGEVSAYIYRETVLLSVIGMALGLALGVVLHTFVVRTAEIDAVMFGRSIYPLSFVYAGLLTLAFTAIVSLFMHKKLKKIDMVQSLKSNE